MTIIGFGLNHKTAPLALLERVSFTQDAMNDFLGSLCTGDVVTEAFGLSTCNRSEFILSTTDVDRGLGLLLARLQERKKVDLATQPEHTFFYTDEVAIRHVFEVACGIDSLVVGENEILGQLRRAREAASDGGFIGEVLDPLLLRAIDVGRRARHSTAISRGNVSVASVAATLAIRTLGDLAGKKGIILGAGKTAEAAAIQMSERGLKDLTIANRSFERAHMVANSLGARQASLQQVGEMLLDADVMVCATGAPHFVITVPMVSWAMSSRPQRALVLLDVSVPRNIDPAVGELPGVHLYSLEDLTQLAEENRAQREKQVVEVNHLIEEEIAAWDEMRQTSDSAELVAALHRQMEQVRRTYVGRHEHHFPESEHVQLEMFSAGLTRKLFHELVENLRGLNLDTFEGQRRYEFARELLNMGKGEKKKK
jgi:glutamyl-tRNA reductase